MASHIQSVGPNIREASASSQEKRGEGLEDVAMSCAKDERIITLAVDFFRAESRVRERTIFEAEPTTLTDPSYYGSYLCEAQESGACIDLQPINGIAHPRLLKKLFQKTHVTNFRAQLQYLAEKAEVVREGCRIFVLDVKDSKGLYLDKEEIIESEKAVVAFSREKRPKEKSPRQEIYDILQENQVHYVFLEGSLKNRIVTKIMTAEQADFLQKTPRGKEVLCMLCEVVMNLFKKGYDLRAPVAEGEGEAHMYTLAAEEYIAPLNKAEPVLPPEGVHDISLLTLYPRFYQALYGKEEQYYRAISAIHNVMHNFDESTGTTAITIQE